MKFKIEKELFQWEKDRIITLELSPKDPKITILEFYNADSKVGEAEVLNNNQVLIPNYLLRSAKPLMVLACIGKIGDTQPIDRKQFNIVPRPIPEGYTDDSAPPEVPGQSNTNENAKNAVLFIKQELTAEQKAQARANISKYEWKTYSVGGQKRPYILAVVDYNTSEDAILDWSIAETLASPNSWGQSQGFTAFYDMIDCAYALQGASQSMAVSIMPDYAACVKALHDAGAWNVYGKNATVIVDKNGVISQWFVTSIQGSEIGITIFDNEQPRKISITYDTNLEQIVSFTKMQAIDKTLTQTGNYADAKAVGDALALKADQTALDELSTLVGDTSVVTQINDALQNSVADWNQTDETAVDFIKNKPDIATDDEIIDLLIEQDMLSAVSDGDGSILADNGEILLW